MAKVYYKSLLCIIQYLVKFRWCNWLTLITWCRIESSISQECNSKILLHSPECKSTIRFWLLHSFCFSINPIRRTLFGRWSQFVYTRFSTLGKCDLRQALLFKKNLKMAGDCYTCFSEKTPKFLNLLRILTLKIEKDRQNTPFLVCI